MKLFKNFKTKRELREENEKLKLRLSSIPPQIYHTQRDAKQVRASISISCEELKYIPDEYIKRQIAHNMMTEIEPLISYDFYDDDYGNKVYTGIIYVGLGDRLGG